eukprot:4154186-Amphidinium_carterae.1
MHAFSRTHSRIAPIAWIVRDTSDLRNSASVTVPSMQTLKLRTRQISESNLRFVEPAMELVLAKLLTADWPPIEVFRANRSQLQAALNHARAICQGGKNPGMKNPGIKN